MFCSRMLTGLAQSSNSGYGEASSGSTQYVDDAQIYEYEQQRNESRSRQENQQYGKDDEEKDMW